MSNLPSTDDASARANRFLRACRGEPTDTTPVWIMRQAGRYLPAYRATRARAGDFLTLCKTPELACEVTLQPVDQLGVDAAIIFSDILIPLEAMGIPLTFSEGEGPRLEPVRGEAAVNALRLFDPEVETRPMMDAIRLTVRGLGGRVPLIGFAGAPWTVFCYAVEGQGMASRGWLGAKRWLFESPQLAHALLARLTEATIGYLAAQVKAGCGALQLFDSWAGALAVEEYRTFALPYVQQILGALRPLGVPLIYFCNEGAGLLGDAAGAGADVLGVDFHTPIDEARRRARAEQVTLQGNLDPVALFAPAADIERRAADIIRRAGTRHVFNLGHGILPPTPARARRRARRRRAPARARAPRRDTRWRRGARSDSRMSPAAPLRPEVPDVSAEMLAKNNKPGPRYTSYPTAPEFSESFGEAQYREHLARADERSWEPLSLYVHIPFCESMCTYCGCHVIIARNKDKFSIYLDHVEREIELTAAALPRRRSVAQLHWGGGTPTSLSEPQIVRLFEIITRHFTLAPGAEVALEVDPCVTTDGQVTLLRSLGFNRVSMGVQDFTHEVQVAVNRIQSFELTKKLYDRCRELGFGSINLDLIYGLPHQTPDNFQHTLDQVIGLRPDRVAVFNFAHVPWMKPHQRKIDEAHLPSTMMRFEIFARTLRSFAEAGYAQIGMDHFALPDDELAVAQRAHQLHRNFMGYITRPAPDQIGLGVSAIGDVAGAYAQNVKWLNEYYQAVEAGRLPVQRGFVLSPDDQLRRYVIHQIMCNFVLDVKEVERRFAIDFRDYFAEEQRPLAEHTAAGFVKYDGGGGGGRIEVTPVGRIFVRNVAMTFDKYLRRPKKDDRPLFSRTV